MSAQKKGSRKRDEDESGDVEEIIQKRRPRAGSFEGGLNLFGFQPGSHCQEAPEDFIITDEDDVFLMGKANLTPEDWPISQPLEGLFPPVVTERNAVFLVIPSPTEENPERIQVIFFEASHPRLWQTSNVQQFQKKVLHGLEIIKSFGLYTNEPFLVSMDAPVKTETLDYATWHQDDFPSNFILPELRYLVQNAFTDSSLSDFTFIGYANENPCVSTSVKIPGQPEGDCDYLRFIARRGVVLGVNNPELDHSSPFVDERGTRIDRSKGNNMLLPFLKKLNGCSDSSDAEKRFLIRTQTIIVSRDYANYVVALSEKEEERGAAAAVAAAVAREEAAASAQTFSTPEEAYQFRANLTKKLNQLKLGQLNKNNFFTLTIDAPPAVKKITKTYKMAEYLEGSREQEAGGSKKKRTSRKLKKVKNTKKATSRKLKKVKKVKKVKKATSRKLQKTKRIKNTKK
jgi:hypothetical protein